MNSMQRHTSSQSQQAGSVTTAGSVMVSTVVGQGSPLVLALVLHWSVQHTALVVLFMVLFSLFSAGAVLVPRLLKNTKKHKSTSTSTPGTSSAVSTKNPYYSAAGTSTVVLQ